MYTQEMSSKALVTELRYWEPVFVFLSWSFVFFIDINLSLHEIFPAFLAGYELRVDILPDFIGWLLLIIGFSRSGLKTTRKKHFLWLCSIAFSVAVIHAVLSAWLPNKIPGRIVVIPLHSLWFCLGFLELAIIWPICSVIINYAQAHNKYLYIKMGYCIKIGYLLMLIWFLFVFVMLEFILAGFISSPVSPSMIRMIILGIATFFSVFFGVVLRIIAMFFVRKAGKLCIKNT